jgi:hypothetical protein
MTAKRQAEAIAGRCLRDVMVLQFFLPPRASQSNATLACTPVCGWGDAKNLGDRLDFPTQRAAAPIPVFVDEPDHFLNWRSSLAPKKWAAAFRMSLARRSSAFSRFRRFEPLLGAARSQVIDNPVLFAAWSSKQPR